MRLKLQRNTTGCLSANIDAALQNLTHVLQSQHQAITADGSKYVQSTDIMVYGHIISSQQLPTRDLPSDGQ